jgi:hypothetical protein
LFHQIDELLMNLLPQVERFEGRLRVSRQSMGDGASELEKVEKSTEPPLVAATPPVRAAK